MHDQSRSLRATTIVRSPRVRYVKTQRLEQQCYLTTLGPDKIIWGHVATLIEVPH